MTTRKERVATVSRQIEEKWEPYWWTNMMKLINEIDIDNDDLSLLSYSPHITCERVAANMGVIFWDFDDLYERGVIDDEFIKKHDIVVAVSDKKLYKNLTFENMSTTLPDFDTWHPSDVTGVMPLSEIDAHIEHYPWSMRVLERRKDVTLDFVVKWSGIKEINFDSEYINASLVDIKKHEAYWLKHIDWELYVQYNRLMTREIVHEYFEDICYKLQLNRQYNSGFMQHLTFEMYLYYIGQTGRIHTKESLDKLLLNENTYKTLNIILNTDSHYAYSFRLFQSNGDVNLSIVEKYPYIQWNLNYLATNQTNTVELFKKYEENIVTRHVLRCAHNMTFEYLISRKDDIKKYTNDFTCHPKYLLNEEYVYEKEKFEERRKREHLAAYRIQQWWLRVTSHPDNPVCKRRLEQDYEEMFQVTPNL
jgi:hypothetical protein